MIANRNVAEEDIQMTKGTKLKWLFGYEVSQVPVRLRVTKESKEGKGSVVLAIVIHRALWRREQHSVLVEVLPLRPWENAI